MHTRVLVVGGGPAGSTAARLLAVSGLDVILIEKDLRYNKPCGGGIPSGVFAEFGIPVNIPHHCVESLRVVFPSDRRLDIPLNGGSIIVVERQTFDSMLRGLAEKAGAQVIEGMFLNVRTDERRLVSEVLINGRYEKIESEYLIASDGVNSRVRRSLGISPSGFVYTHSSRVNGGRKDVCEFWFSSKHAPGSYSWIFPKGESISVGTGVSDAKRSDEYFKRFLKRAGIDGSSVERPRGYKIPLWDDKLYNEGRVLFAGDSASQVMPFTFEGIYYAMKSGEFAVRAVINNNPSLYRKLWRQRFYSRFRLMNKIKDFFLSDDSRMERLYDVFSMPEVQDISMKLWLRKEAKQESLFSYINIFRKFLH